MRACVGGGCVGVWVCGCVGVWVCGCVGHLNHPPPCLLAKVIVTVTNAKGLEDKTETVKDGRELDTPLFMVNFILLLVSLSYMSVILYS